MLLSVEAATATLTKMEVASGADPKMVDAIKFIYVWARAFHIEDVTPQLATLAKKWGMSAKPFATKWGVPAKTWDKMIELTPQLGVGSKVFKSFFDNPKFEPKIEPIDEAMDELYASTKAGALSKDLTISRDYRALLSDASYAFGSGSEPAFRRLDTKLSLLSEPALLKHGSEKDKPTITPSAKTKVKRLEEIVKKMTGKPGWFLPIGPTGEALRKKNPKDAEAYAALSKELRELYKSHLRSLVRGSGSVTLDVKVVRDKLNGLGMWHPIPDAFVGKIDDQGKYYTSDDELLAATPQGEVVMNKKWPNATIYCQSKLPGAATWTKIQTVGHKKKAKSEVFDTVRSVIPDIDNLRRKWLKDLKDTRMSDEKVYATLTELAYLTAPRVGSGTGKTGGKTTYGISTVLVSMVKFAGNKMTISYLGKSGQKQTHVIEGTTDAKKILVKNVQELVGDKGPKDQVFTLPNGSPVKGTKINGYLHHIGFPSEFTFHKFRKVRGTRLMQESSNEVLMDLAKKVKAGKKTIKDLEEGIIDALTDVGEVLGHFTKDRKTGKAKTQWTTALTAYVDPKILADLYRAAGHPPSSQIAKAIQEALAEGEGA